MTSSSTAPLQFEYVGLELVPPTVHPTFTYPANSNKSPTPIVPRPAAIQNDLTTHPVDELDGPQVLPVNPLSGTS